MRTGLPADAYWFSQFGFKMGQVSEEKKRDYGFGIPFWSPYNRPKGGPQRCFRAAHAQRFPVVSQGHARKSQGQQFS